MSALFLRTAFSDFESLAEVCKGRLPSRDKLLMRLFLMERRSNPALPDHFFKDYLNHRLGGIRGVDEIVSTVFEHMCNRFLNKVAGRWRIHNESFSDWQDAIGSLSPLALTTFAVAESTERVSRGGEVPVELLRAELGPTALLAPYLPTIDDLVERAGLFDLHMHLNGSTEVDGIWIDMVTRPLFYLPELHSAHAKSVAVQELYSQVEAGLTPATLCRRLLAARRVRHLVARELGRLNDGLTSEINEYDLLSTMCVKSSDSDFKVLSGLRLSRSPFYSFWTGNEVTDPVLAEAAFLFACFDGLKKYPQLRPLIGTMLWFNFTMFALVARLSIQQVDQAGFHQFDKFNAAGLREPIEQQYAARFGQLSGIDGRDLSYIDARFAPKRSPHETAALLGRIVQGLLAFRRCPHACRSVGLSGVAAPCLTGPCSCSVRKDRFEVALVAHFIKRPDSKPSPSARHAELRLNLRRQYRSLRYVLRRYDVARKLVRGIDGAGNELDAGPEVFAPTFRALRSSWGSTLRATFHAGEDFAHLVSGIRAVDEALGFLALGEGDRVGHGVALGLKPEVWASRTRERIVGSVENLLDDVVFALGVLRRSAAPVALVADLPRQVEILSERMYGKAFSEELLNRAWRMRHLDIMEVIAIGDRLNPGQRWSAGRLADEARQFASSCIDRDRCREASLIAQAAESDPTAFKLFTLRHRADVRENGQKAVECPVTGDRSLFGVDMMYALQECGRGRLSKKGVTIEVLPTSNLRIVPYSRYHDHHVFRWLGLDGNESETLPMIALGSDDPGVFATNAKNEFIHIYQALLERVGASKAGGVLESINDAGRRVRFKHLS